MNRTAIIILALSLCVLLAMRTQAKTEADSSSNKNTGELKIVVTSLEVNDKALKLTYDIKNHSEDDAWFLAETGFLSQGFGFDMQVGAFIAEDGQTLMLRKRIGTEWDYMTYEPVYARYVRLRPGESQTESIFITMPFLQASNTKRVRQQEQSLKYATRLVIELGYYTVDLRETTHITNLTNKDEEVSLPCLSMFRVRKFKHESEQVLKTVVDNLRISYKEKQIQYPPIIASVKYDPLDLTSCTKIEIRYKPSMLEYFFPYASQQSLMSSKEIEYLKSANLVVDDIEDIKIIARYFSKAIAVDSGVVVRYRSSVDVVCYYDDKPSISFPIYDDYAIIDKKDELLCLAGFPSLTMRIPHINKISLRLQCVENLKIQWYYRFRFYNSPEALGRNALPIKDKIIYPTPTEWCDAILRAFRAQSYSEKGLKSEFKCPSAGEDKCHYAMNPNCEPNSPPDMVLLFETKAGWNQHGGPELFTFDNHDPKGGCVLLNDGTVKFIRTKEELQQLRWK